MADVHSTETYQSLQAWLLGGGGAAIADTQALRLAAADALMTDITGDETVTYGAAPLSSFVTSNAYSPEAMIKYGK